MPVHIEFVARSHTDTEASPGGEPLTLGVIRPVDEIAIRVRAKDALLNQEIASEEIVNKVAYELRDVEGMNLELIEVLADKGICTIDDLADLAIDELTEITGQSQDNAKNLILKAREHWFAGETAVHG